jgi:hypothetical protein
MFTGRTVYVRKPGLRHEGEPRHSTPITHLFYTHASAFHAELPVKATLVLTGRASSYKR